MRRCTLVLAALAKTLGAPLSRATTTSNSSSATLSPAFAWSSIDGWCALCREPINSVNEHMGKREHICLQMVYQALVTHRDRRWDPMLVWAELEEGASLPPLRMEAPHMHLRGADKRDHRCCRRQRGKRWKHTAGAMSEELHAMMGTSPSNPLLPIFNAYDQHIPLLRRRELGLALKVLQDRKLLLLNSQTFPTAIAHGNIVLCRELFAPLACIFPTAEAKDISALTQMVSATYNSETMFDLCHFEQVVSPDLLSTRLPVITDSMDDLPAGDCDATSGDHIISSSGNGSLGGAGGGLSFAFKGAYIRAAMGALRWSLEPDLVAPPTPQLAAAPHKHGPDYALAAHTARLMVAELIHCKISEYVVRVEGVVRGAEGVAEAQRLARSSAVGDTRHMTRCQARSGNSGLTPPLSNWGLREYVGRR